MRLSATAYGFAGASINIAGNINFGVAANNEDSIGIKGKALTLADYNENEVTQTRVVDTQSLPKPYKNVDKVAADSSVTVDIFAGVRQEALVRALLAGEHQKSSTMAWL